MIELHRKESDAEADKIEQAFRELTLAYKTKIHTNDAEEQLPRIKDGERWISGEGDIDNWLTKLRSELEWQRSLSGDGCYIDPESGEIC